MSRPFNLGATESRNVRTASSTPPRGHAGGSCVPVLAPLGAATLPNARPARISTSTVGFPRLSKIFRIEAPSMEGIPQPHHVQRPAPRCELADGDFQRVPCGFGREERRRSHRNLEGARAKDAGSLETSVRQETVSAATKGWTTKKVSPPRGGRNPHRKWWRTRIR